MKTQGTNKKNWSTPTVKILSVKNDTTAGTGMANETGMGTRKPGS